MSHTPDYGGQNPRSSPSQEAGPSRSPAPSGDQHAYLPFESLSSPSAPRMLPSTAAVLQARRQAFFKSPSSSRAAAAASIAASASRQASRNDTGMQLQAGPAPPRLRRTGWRSPQSGSAGAGPDADSPQQHVWRARFRERCQQHMRRDRARAVAKSRAQVGRPELMGSDELESSSDVEGDEEMAEWEEEDEELIRRVMTSEYRRLRRAQEYSGRRELGWLGPDEIAFLEEELRREESANLGADMSGYDQELEPPPDMLDEDADLYAQFEHAQAQAQAQPGADELNMVNELDVDWDDAEMDLL